MDAPFPRLKLVGYCSQRVRHAWGLAWGQAFLFSVSRGPKGSDPDPSPKAVIGADSRVDGKDCPSSTEPGNLPEGRQTCAVVASTSAPCQRRPVRPPRGAARPGSELLASLETENRSSDPRALITGAMSRRLALAQIHEFTDRIVRPPLNLRTCRQAVRSAWSSRPRRLMPSPTGDETASRRRDRGQTFWLPGTENRSPDPRAPSLRCPRWKAIPATKMRGMPSGRSRQKPLCKSGGGGTPSSPPRSSLNYRTNRTRLGGRGRAAGCSGRPAGGCRG